MRSIALATAVLGTLAVLAPAMAGDDRLKVPSDKWQSPTAVGEKLAAQGYKVHEIESDDGAYEVKVTDKNGVRIEMYVHPETGEILPGYDD